MTEEKLVVRFDPSFGKVHVSIGDKEHYLTKEEWTNFCGSWMAYLKNRRKTFCRVCGGAGMTWRYSEETHNIEVFDCRSCNGSGEQDDDNIYYQESKDG